MVRIPGRPQRNLRFKAEDFIRNARHKSAPGGELSAAKMDETLYFIHQIKNGMTVKTGEYEALTRLFTGQKMFVDTRDISLAPHLMFDGIWEEPLTKLILSALNENSVFLDVGANFGYFGLIAGTKIKNGSLHFFEPNPKLASYIRKSLPINGLERISKVNQVAVGQKHDKLTLHVPEHYFGSGSIREINYDTDSLEALEEIESLEVEQISLDNYVAQKNLKHIDVIKIDVEGFEDIVYAGMHNVIEDNPELVIFLEFTPLGYKDPEKFFKQIHKDFNYIYLIEKNLERVESLADLQATIDRDGFAMLALAHQDI